MSSSAVTAPSQARGPRGPYAKGIERRGRILEAAFEAYASSGREGPSLRAIADAVGVAESGILHYFDSKDHLFVEVLRARDEQADSNHDFSTLGGATDMLRETTRTPGLAKLFLDMAAASVDPDHPAHAYFLERQEVLLAQVRGYLGGGRSHRDWRARTVIAAAEGLQIQWLRDPSIDIVGDVARLIAALREDEDPNGSGRVRPQEH